MVRYEFRFHLNQNVVNYHVVKKETYLNQSNLEIKSGRKFVHVSIAIFVFAMMLPCVDTQFDKGVAGEGAILLLTGLIGLFSSKTAMVWLANPLLLTAWVNLSKRPGIALVASFGSLFIALLFLNCKELPINEGGETPIITGYRIGYWLWLSSIAMMLPASIYLKLRLYFKMS